MSPSEMSNKSPLHLFEAFGVELEYMIVDRDSLAVMPIAHKLIEDKLGHIANDVEEGDIAWSNELVSHVIELKTNGPSSVLNGLPDKFLNQIQEINQRLEKWNAMLLPGAAHPFFNPDLETVLWPYDNKEIYDCYNDIFNCKGHGWSNLQSVHLNLPFHGDEEFGRLHAAIRLILPLIPALSASSPIIELKETGFKSTRLEYYRKNQQAVPSISGLIIPERVFSEKDYYEKIFDPILQDMEKLDPKHVLEHQFLNSRGAIARFDRGAIEIRLLDIQECPLGDVAVLSAIVEVLKKLVSESWLSYENQCKWSEKELYSIFLKTIQSGEDTLIENIDFLKIFGISLPKMMVGDLWRFIVEQLDFPYKDPFIWILENGSLSTRILKKMDNSVNRPNILQCYGELARCLASNSFFSPRKSA